MTRFLNGTCHQVFETHINLKHRLVSVQGFFRSTKKYSGKVTLASLKSGVKNKTLELGMLNHGRLYLFICYFFFFSICS